MGFAGNATTFVSRVDSGISSPNFYKYFVSPKESYAKNYMALFFCGHSVY